MTTSPYGSTFERPVSAGIGEARNAMAARIAPNDRVSVEGVDIVEVRRHDTCVRLYFHERISGNIHVILNGNVDLRNWGPIEVALDSPEFSRVLAAALEKVGARLKKG